MRYRVGRPPLLLISVILLPGLGCSRESGGAGAQGASASASVSAPAPGPSAQVGVPRASRHGRNWARGPGTRLLRLALGLSDIRPEQRPKLGTLRGLLRGPEREQAASGQALDVALAAAVRRGKLTVLEFEPQFQKRDLQERSHRKVQVQLLNRLHAVLSPSQRDLVARGAEDGGGRRARGEHGPRRRVEGLTVGLELDEAQRGKLEALIAKLGRPSAGTRQAGPKKRAAKLMAAFPSESFDASQLDLARQGDGLARRDRSLVESVVLVAGILTKEQREKLAARVESGRLRRVRLQARTRGESDGDGGAGAAKK